MRTIAEKRAESLPSERAFRASRLPAVGRIRARTILSSAVSPLEYGTLPYFHTRYPVVHLNTPRRFNPRKHARFIPLIREREKERREKLRAGRAAETLRLDYKRKKDLQPSYEIHTHFAPSIIKGYAVLSPVSSSPVESHFLASLR